MIDCEISFGAFVPKVPKIYKDLARKDEDNDNSINEARASSCAIGPKWTALKLRSRYAYNHDTSIFEFELPDNIMFLELPVTAHLLVRVPCQEHGGENNTVRPYTAINEANKGSFSLMVKRYDKWGVPESDQSQNRYFLHVKTDHSYKPPGVVSNYIHSLKIGQSLDFKHSDICLGKITYPFHESITAITMIAVGIGVSPMIRILRALLDSNDLNATCPHVTKIRLMYGVRTVADILQRKQLDKWHDQCALSERRFQVCYCVGSRWANINFAAKTSSREGPALPKAWDDIGSDRKALGWVDGDKIKMYGASNSDDDGHRVFICGLPGVYMALAGPRMNPTVEAGTQLHQLGYQDHQVIKF